MPLVVHITTVPQSLAFVAGLADHLRARGYEMKAISSPGEKLKAFEKSEGIETFGIPMSRKISPVSDVRSLAELTALLRNLQPDIVHAHTPKAGLLGMLGAMAARVPVRIYHLRGLPLLTAEGARAAVLARAERTSCLLAHKVLCESQSLREVTLDHRLCAPEKIQVLGPGSSGVDSEVRFNPERLPDARAESRRTLSIPMDARVFGFVGRLVKDKGISDLAAAWKVLRAEFPDSHLLVVGPFEEEDPVPDSVRQELWGDPRAHLVGLQDEPAPFYAAMDLVCLPSYREGFPNVPLEAAAMGLPVVATRIPGTVDAIIDGKTGQLVPIKDPPALIGALRRYALSPELRRAHGREGQERVRRNFKREPIHQATFEVYEKMIRRTTVPSPR